MPDYRLLRHQKNDTLDILEAFELDPREFEWRDNTIQTSHRSHSETVSTSELHHVPSGFYFKFSHNGANPTAEFSPGDEQRIQFANPGSFRYQMQYFHTWVNALKTELDAPDLWAELAETKHPLAEVTSGEMANTPFSPAEREYIKQQTMLLVQAVSERLDQTELNAEQLAEVNAKLDYLVEASENQPRREWGFIMLGVVLNLIVGGMFAPDVAKQIYEAAVSAYAPLFHTVLQLPRQ